MAPVELIRTSPPPYILSPSSAALRPLLQRRLACALVYSRCHDAGQFLWPDDNQRHDPNYDELASVKIEHQKTSLKKRVSQLTGDFGAGICGPRPPRLAHGRIFNFGIGPPAVQLRLRVSGSLAWSAAV